MSVINIKKLYVTSGSRIDLSMSDSGIYLTIYKPISKTKNKNNRELPLFRKIESDGTIIENKVTIKFEEEEIAFIKWIMEEYLKYINNEKVIKKILLLSQLNDIHVSKSEHSGKYYISFFRPSRPFDVKLLKNGISITINDKSKNPAELYSAIIHITAFPYIISVFDFVIKEYLKTYKYEIKGNIKDNRQNNNRTQQQEQRTNNSVSNAEIAEPIMDDSEDDFDFE